MKKLLVAFLALTLTSFATLPSGFREEQLLSERVKTAYRNHQETVAAMLKANQIPADELELFIRILKWEKLVEVWGKGRHQDRYSLLRIYPICAVSGKLGPKQQKGDRQIPEGFYYLNRFHPASRFHLSLGLNYPNQADSLRCTTGEPGGDIFLHGGCSTIGCIPITDQIIEELYVLAVEARHNGQIQIPVHLFPGILDSLSYSMLRANHADKPELLAFWESMQPGFAWFEKHRTLPPVQVHPNGTYVCGRR